MIQRTDAIVIRAKDWRETSKIITFYTNSFGKVSAIARGVRRKNKREFGGGIELLTRGDLIYYEREQRGLQVVSQWSINESFQELRESLTGLAYGSYIAELVDRLVTGKEKSRKLFGLILESLRATSKEGDNSTVARFFEVQFLKLLGYDPMLSSCVVCRRDELNGSIKFSASLGGCLCTNCFLKDKEAIPISNGAVSTIKHLGRTDAAKVKRLKLSPVLKKEVEKILSFYLSHFLEGELKSMEFLNKLHVSS